MGLTGGDGEAVEDGPRARARRRRCVVEAAAQDERGGLGFDRWRVTSSDAQISKGAGMVICAAAETGFHGSERGEARHGAGVGQCHGCFGGGIGLMWNC
ncbi:hypothetical protein M0R45_036276 [Rubus argutus]|uniref:Uncharacterized protein n=1 Tax=Rubus argutus TaxID=59490 RepID=A0AAW1VZS6_RUBAR